MAARITLTKRFYVAAAGALVGALLAGCSSDPALPADFSQPLLIRETGPGALVQTVHLSASTLAQGEALRIRSVITNEGTAAVPLTSSICGLHLETRLQFAPQARCAGYSMGGTIAPGASREEHDGGVVVSAPGVYVVRVRHMLEPEEWVTFRIAVTR